MITESRLWIKLKELENKIINMIKGGDISDPNFSGSISLGREKGSDIGENSVATGNLAEASGLFSHAEGNSAHAIGQQSHAEGLATYANAPSSHVEGEGTFVTANAGHVQGKYNKTSNAAFVVGNGTGPSLEDRSDALVLDWEGNLTVSGDVLGKNIQNISNLLSRISMEYSGNIASKQQIDIVSDRSHAHDVFIIFFGTWNQQVIEIATINDYGTVTETILHHYPNATYKEGLVSWIASDFGGFSITNDLSTAMPLIVYRIHK